jgi:hypothetical protein
MTGEPPAYWRVQKVFEISDLFLLSAWVLAGFRA